uniref:Uncharacterized protein n=1 Tax=Setaria italica TaxID=4555 RepID=A0A0Q3PM46_SETIT
MAATSTSPLFSLSSLSASLPSPTRLPSSLSLRALSPRARLSASLPFASPHGTVLCLAPLLSLPRQFCVLPHRCFCCSLVFSGGCGAWAATSTSSAGKLRRRGLEVVCEATTGRRPDSVAKRERQNEKHRIRNHARKAEMRTRMKK